MKAFIYVYLALCTCNVHSIQPNDMLSILEFCENNGKRHLNIFTLDGQDPDVQIAKEDLTHVANWRGSLGSGYHIPRKRYQSCGCEP